MFIQTYKSFTFFCCFASSNRLQRLKVPRAESFETPKGLLKSADHIYLPLFLQDLQFAVAESKQACPSMGERIETAGVREYLGGHKIGREEYLGKVGIVILLLKSPVL